MFPDMFEIFNSDEDKEEKKSPSSSPAPAAPVFQGEAGKFFSVSVGGSVLIEDKPNAAKIAKFGESINNLLREGYKFALVLGGGKTCRNYQAAAKSLGAGNFFLDSIGIDVTRVNASLLSLVVDNAFPRVVTNIWGVREIVEQGITPICGGMMPGFTTDAVAALIAEQMSGTFINLSNVDGVYSADPNKSKSAKFYPELSYERLASIISMAQTGPGQNVVLDMPACLVLQRSKIPAFFVNGNSLDQFEAAVKGLEFHGTIVSERITDHSPEPEPIPVRRRAVRKVETHVQEEPEDTEIDPDEIKF